ncbi:MAG: RraA family protein [Actinomycetota bacterium]
MSAPPTDPRALAAGVTSSAVCDAMARRFAHRAHVIDLVTPTPDAVLVGPVATLQFMPNRRDLHPDGGDRFDALLADAAAGAAPGAVLVMSSAGHPDEALAGGKKVARVEAAGFAGLVCDGRLRDMDEIAGFDVACFARGETIRAAGDRVTPFAANVPVVVAGVTVVPGDWVFADRSGAVIVPAGAVTDILDEARRLEERDAAAVARIRGT